MTTDPQSPDTEKPSSQDRRFRRYKRAELRRRKAERADTVFYRAVFSIAGVGAALAIGLAVMVMNGGVDMSAMGNLAEPWIGSMSRLDALGIGFILMLAALYFWRVRKR